MADTLLKRLRAGALTGLLLGSLVGSIVPVHASEIGSTPDALGEFMQHQGWVAVPDAPMSGWADAAPNPPAAPHASLVLHALGFLGVPYRLGGESAEEGFDCSGFVQAAFRQVFGKRLPRTSAEQARTTAAIERSELQPGDLVFFNTLGRRYSHVGIYIGERRFVHSPRSGARIRIENMGVRYWATRFNGARRVHAPAELLEARAAQTLLAAQAQASRTTAGPGN